MQMPKQFPPEVRAEALLIAEREGRLSGDLPIIEAVVAARMFRQAIRPMIALKAKVYSMFMRPIVLNEHGELVPSEYEFPPEVAKQLACVDALILGEARRFSAAEQPVKP